jgi:hypothetical protein
MHTGAKCLGNLQLLLLLLQQTSDEVSDRR